MKTIKITVYDKVTKKKKILTAIDFDNKIATSDKNRWKSFDLNFKNLEFLNIEVIL